MALSSLQTSRSDTSEALQPHSLRRQTCVPHPSSDHSFFFQAEDGIRDGHVTRVQTCALPICRPAADLGSMALLASGFGDAFRMGIVLVFRDRKSTRLNSSHVAISYAVFC